MKKIVHNIVKVLLSLLLISPIFGALGVFPEPTRELYNTDEAFAFIRMLMDSGYIMPIMALCFAGAFFCLWTRREALAALLLLPFTVNIVAFHMFLDGGVFTPGAIMGNLLLLVNVYLLWRERAEYMALLKSKSQNES